VVLYFGDELDVKRRSNRLSYLYKPATTTSNAKSVQAAITVIRLEPSLLSLHRWSRWGEGGVGSWVGGVGGG